MMPPVFSALLALVVGLFRSRASLYLEHIALRHQLAVLLLRIALQPGPPLWQILLSVGLTASATVLAVWAAGRIFRTGILMQGKSASVAEMIRWARAG